MKTLLYYLRTKVSRWHIDDLVDSIITDAWRWAKAKYEKETEKLRVSVYVFKPLEAYLWVLITQPQAESFRKTAFQMTFLGGAVAIFESYLTYDVAKFWFFGARPIEELSSFELFKLFGSTFVITVIITLGFGWAIFALNSTSLLKSRRVYRIPGKIAVQSIQERIIVALIACIVLVFTVILAYFRVLNSKGAVDIISFLFSITLQLGTGIVAAFAFYYAFTNSQLYKAWQKKNQFEQLYQKFMDAQKARLRIQADLSDKAASRFFYRVRMVRAWLKYPEENLLNPKTSAEFRKLLWEQFDKATQGNADNKESYERPLFPPQQDLFEEGKEERYLSPEKTSSYNGVKRRGFRYTLRGLFSWLFSYFLVLSISSCDLIEKRDSSSTNRKSSSEKKELFVRVLVDVSGTTSDARWSEYQKGIFEVLLSMRGSGSMIVYPIDEAAFPEPSRMISVDFRANDFGDNEGLRNVLASLPDTLKPPFNPRGDFEKKQMIFERRILPFTERIWPLLARELDSAAAARRIYAGSTDIIGAVQVAQQDFDKVKTEKGNIFGTKSPPEKWLFIFSDLIQHSSNNLNLNFARPLGVTRDETRKILPLLEVLPLNDVKVVLIGRGRVIGGPTSSDGIANIEFFWREYFTKANAQLMHIGSTDDRADIARILAEN